MGAPIWPDWPLCYWWNEEKWSDGHEPTIQQLNDIDMERDRPIKDDGV